MKMPLTMDTETRITTKKNKKNKKEKEHTHSTREGPHPEIFQGFGIRIEALEARKYSHDGR